MGFSTGFRASFCSASAETPLVDVSWLVFLTISGERGNMSHFLNLTFFTAKRVFILNNSYSIYLYKYLVLYTVLKQVINC